MTYLSAQPSITKQSQRHRMPNPNSPSMTHEDIREYASCMAHTNKASFLTAYHRHGLDAIIIRKYSIDTESPCPCWGELWSVHPPELLVFNINATIRLYKTQKLAELVFTTNRIVSRTHKDPKPLQRSKSKPFRRISLIVACTTAHPLGSSAGCLDLKWTHIHNSPYLLQRQ